MSNLVDLQTSRKISPFQDHNGQVSLSPAVDVSTEVAKETVTVQVP